MYGYSLLKDRHTSVSWRAHVCDTSWDQQHCTHTRTLTVQRRVLVRARRLHGYGETHFAELGVSVSISAPPSKQPQGNATDNGKCQVVRAAQREEHHEQRH